MDGLFDAVLAGDAEQARAGEAAGPKTLGVVGEWELVASDALTGGIFPRLVVEGMRIRRAPVAEYLWFLWNDDLASERNELERRGAEEGSETPAPQEIERRQALLDRLSRRMGEVSRELGDASSFSPDLPALVAEADDGIGGFAGGGGRYRYAKARELARTMDGVVTVSSMYENTGTILQLLPGRVTNVDAGVAGSDATPGVPVASGVPAAPMLALTFDGSPGQAAWERLRSFLYYL